MSVQGVTSRAGEQYQVAFLEDQEGRRWVVRVPLNQVAAAQLEQSESLTRLLARRLPFSVPVPHGFAQLKEGGHAVVYPRLAGSPLDWSRLPPASAVAAHVGRAIAAVHNVDRALFEEAGVPSYDADGYRGRHLAELDRGAATGHVPTTLLSRWEQALEEIALWRFAPSPTHGHLTDRHVLVADTDPGGDPAQEAESVVKGITGWERAQVADPADDFALLIHACEPAAFDTVLEAYAHARSERPDAHLERRARLAGELRGLTALLEAVTAGDDELVERRAAGLRRLDRHAHDIDLVPPATRPVTAGLPAFSDGLEGGELADLDAPPETEQGDVDEPADVTTGESRDVADQQQAASHEPGETVVYRSGPDPDGDSPQAPTHQPEAAAGDGAPNEPAEDRREPPADGLPEPQAEASGEPVAEASPEPVAGASAEPVAEASPEPAPDERPEARDDGSGALVTDESDQPADVPHPPGDEPAAEPNEEPYEDEFDAVEFTAPMGDDERGDLEFGAPAEAGVPEFDAEQDGAGDEARDTRS